MTVPDFVLDLRRHIGHAPLWLPGCTAVVLRTGATSGQAEVLVVRRRDTGRWTPVTGIVDPGEEAADACVREVAEEAGIVARPVRFLATEVLGPVTYPNGDVASYLDLAFALDWVSGEPYPADGENTEACFVAVGEMPPMGDYFQRVTAQALAGTEVAAFRWENSPFH